MKKKKGSSLIFVVVTFAVIATFGFSILSLTLVSYKKRFVETTEKRNQYFSESGLDIAYGIIGNIVDEGIKEGNTAVDVYMNTLNGEDGILQQEKEKLKNGEIPAYPRPNNNTKSLYIEDDGVTVNEGYVKEQQNITFKQAYMDYVENNIKDNWNSEDNNLTRTIPMKDEDYSSTNIVNKPSVKIYNKDDENRPVEVEFKDINNYRNTNKRQSVLALYLKSNFTDQNVKKIINVGYDILTPDYNAIYYTSTNNFKLPIISVWNNKAICIDGDLKIGGTFNVTGDIYVKGTDTDDGGININNSNSVVTLTGNASTSQNFKISKPNNTVTVNGSGNVYASNVEIAEGADSSNLTVQNSVYTNNDLALNATTSHIDIANFYGINDISKFQSIIQTKVSSCIRVNSEDLGSGSSIKISNDAILMGTAYIKISDDSTLTETTHINTDDNSKSFYQTGESVAVKGNYRAYTEGLTSEEAARQDQYYGGDKNKPKQSLKEDNVVFDYLDPLRLVTRFRDTDNTDLNWQDKSDYFSIYVDEHKNDTNNELNLGDGITLPMAADLQPGERADKNIIHTGAIIANGNVYNGNYYGDNDGKVADKQNSFASMVYEMGDVKDLANVYAQGKVKKAVYSSDPEVENQVDFGEISNTPGDEVTKNSNNDIIYLNNDNSKDCVIVGKDATNIPSGTQIKLDDNGVGRGIIITKGNVYLCGSINFTGVIIAAGNVEVKDSSRKEFVNNNSYIQKLIAYNYEQYFKDVFTGTPETTQNIETNVQINTDNNVKGDLVRKNFIIMRNWKIEK
ncbi:hypothetical protein [Clostridium magnum]|uniref:Uncharacterized protein n=1 Tax=Clostridium magnum DSM 2767 TaxID=1121326 RepID=A0A162U403_9CLOT|nr:hypothetical protein [Clostridium magnum]KZL93403.1 hypothetical protein CLMAG_04270 [Clostridium magnum DSM 2767]SHI15816.1 hypothetical protein SAMN02745944_02806 [Clostridium magnum DSM 2767]